MKVYLTRRYMIAASHRLHTDLLSDAENYATFGKCNNAFGHGHNYGVAVTVGGQVDPRTGMVCNLVDLDECFRREIAERFDHQNLNTLPEFAQLVPTTENLATAIFEILKRELRSAHLEKVRIEETSNNSFEYCGKPNENNSFAPPQDREKQ